MDRGVAQLLQLFALLFVRLEGFLAHRGAESMLARMGRLAVALLACALGAMFLPAPARAGTYAVWSCTGPDGSGSPTDAWRHQGGARFSSPADACATGGGLYTGLNGDFAHPTNTTMMTWVFTAPENTSIAAYRIWRSAQVTPSSLNASPVYWFAWPQNSYDGANVKEQCPATNCGGLGDPSRPRSPANLIGAAGMSGVTSLYLNASCGGEPGFNCNPEESPPGRDTSNVRIHASEITLRDDLDPELSGPSGTLVEPGRVLAGAHGVSVAAGDEGSGLYDILLEVDGQQVASAAISANSGRCVKPFRVVVPCKLAASATATLDTATLPDGAHALRVIVRDAAENQAVYGPVQITTANATNRCGAAGGAVSARFPGRKRRSLRIGFGQRRRIRGRVLDAAGVPVGGASVTPLAVVRRRGEGMRVDGPAVVARPDGTFRYRTAKGPSRALRFGWRPAPTATELTCSRKLRLGVRASARLRALDTTVAPGQRVRLRGKLRGGYVPRRGKVVDLQARDGGRWRTFATARARRRGFSASYRFSASARGTYPMRARVRPDGAYPFALGYSRVIRIRVG